MRYTDIREVKKALRQEFKTIRRSFLPDDKGSRDGKILQKLTALPEYRESPLLLTYVSTAIEVDTHRLIEQAVSDGKRVAVPWCVPGKVEMKFFYVNALSELAPGTFGVLEPVPERAEEPPLFFAVVDFFRVVDATVIPPGNRYFPSRASTSVSAPAAQQ